tara:strand:- start:3900 stop:4436 length:537 start_codon:yes stop_codon:yes gene_type:complete
MRYIDLTTLSKIINFILFQAGWWTAVVGQYPNRWLTITSLALINGITFGGRRRLFVIFIIGLIGIIHDQTLYYAGLFIFSENTLLLPLWFASIWWIFISTFHLSLGFTQGLPRWIQSVFGAIGGSVSYGFGTQIAGVGVPVDFNSQLIIHACDFAILFPLLIAGYQYCCKLVKIPSHY